MPHLLKLCLAVAIAMHPYAASAQQAPLAATAAAATAAQFDAAIAPSFSPDAPGAVVLVVRDGKPIFRKAYGLADVDKGTPMTPAMQLRLGSITKQFTSTAILMLVDAGQIKLDDDITRYLPGFPTHDQRITVENLLNHTSGIVSYTSKPDFEAHMTEDRSVQAMIASFQDDPLEFAPGSRYKYDNSGYFLLGAIIENVSGLSYADFLAQRIFQPLGMVDTAYEGHERGTAIRAPGYSKGEHGYVPTVRISMTQPYAAGALVSTVDDLARWDAAVTAGKLLKPATWQRAFTPAVLTGGKATDYGFGWATGALGGVPTVGHGGGINGYSTFALRVPSQRLYVVVLRNADSDGKLTMAVAKRAAALALGQPAPHP